MRMCVGTWKFGATEIKGVYTQADMGVLKDRIKPETRGCQYYDYEL